jgi:predicted methyltransferase
VYISPRYDELFDKLNPIFETRPTVDTTLDQSKNTVETAIQRVCYFYEKGALEGKDILYIGDDDFSSVSTGLLSKIFYPNEELNLIPNSITVVDIDKRILDNIQSHFTENNLMVNCVEYDLRNGPPTEILNKFDTVITDPPYSPNGLRLFLSRAISFLKPDVNKDIFLSYAHRSPDKTHELQQIINESGLAIMEILPRFNKYEGSELLGNETQMLHLKTTKVTKASILGSETFNNGIYTGETHPYIRIFKCKACNTEISVGPDQEYLTIEQLKGVGCPECEEKKFTLEDKNLKIDPE